LGYCKAVRVAVLANPASSSLDEATLRELSGAARAMGMEIRILNASTSSEIDAAFAALQRERPDALFVAPDAVSLAAACKLPLWRRATGFRRLIFSVSL
jgi:putative ABC transport system substrate-binding protein